MDKRQARRFRREKRTLKRLSNMSHYLDALALTCGQAGNAFYKLAQEMSKAGKIVVSCPTRHGKSYWSKAVKEAKAYYG